MTPLLRPVWCRASAGSFSSTATEIPGNRSVICIAVDSPTIPPPITARSKSAIHLPHSTPRPARETLLYFDPSASRLSSGSADRQRISLVLVGDDRAFGHDRALAQDEVAGDRGADADSYVVLDRRLENDAVVFGDKVVADADRTMDDGTVSDLGVVSDLHTCVLEGVEGDAAADTGATADHDRRPLVGA